jgi:outer membrane protein assembly factor BamB
MEWSSEKNVLWKTPLPDRGNSTPVVWGSRVFLTQAIEETDERLVQCFDLKSGRKLWQAGTVYREEEKTHSQNPYCSASPVVDEERVIAVFGSAGIYCFDHERRELWKSQPGTQDYPWGSGSSPVLWKDLCIVYFGPGPDARLIAINKDNGELVWEWKEPDYRPERRTDGFRGNRNGMICSYSSPLIVEHNGMDSILMLFPGYIRAFDPSSGGLLWESHGMNPLVYTSPVVSDGVVLGMGGYQGTTIATKIPENTEGSTQTVEPLWIQERTSGRIGSAVISKDGLVFILNTPGIMECFDLLTGKVHWEERLPAAGPTRESWSSLVLSGDRIFAINQSGDTIIVKADKEFQVLAVNSIGNELTNSSPVIVGDRFLLRTHENLWCFGNPDTSL